MELEPNWDSLGTRDKSLQIPVGVWIERRVTKTKVGGKPPDSRHRAGK